MKYESDRAFILVGLMLVGAVYSFDAHAANGIACHEAVVAFLIVQVAALAMTNLGDDGIEDDIDNCLEIYNSGQADFDTAVVGDVCEETDLSIEISDDPDLLNNVVYALTPLQ